MTPELKKRIIKRFLEESSLTPVVIAEEAVEAVPNYDRLSSALDGLEISHNDLLDINNVEAAQPKWNMLSRVLHSGITLNLDAPGIFTCDLTEMRKEASLIRTDLYLDTLPQPDYFNRRTQPDLVTQVATVNPLIVSSRNKLAGFLTNTPRGFNSSNNTHIADLITQIKGDIKRAEAAGNQRLVDRAKNQLTVTEDLLKVNQLTALTIPSEHGAPPNVYCTLAEAAGGVTEKVSLVSLAKVTTLLGNLRDTPIVDVNAYIASRANYKLGTEAILKLPKHGSKEEVQHEALALNISRILRLDTTDSSIMTHEGKPALFVPFENIQLLNEFAKGKTFKTVTQKTYEHYATINPVGDGIQADVFVDDFGPAFGLFYVCSDPDSIGGYSQNKALRNGQSLFIFDQVVMPDDGFKLDTRVSLQPVGAWGHTRHGQGRNRTLIEDSALGSKLDSLVQLLTEQEKIDRYVNRVVDQYNVKIQQINIQLALPHSSADDKNLKAQRAVYVTMQKDATNVRDAVNKRIDAVVTSLPKLGENLNVRDLRQALIFEKLLHNPRIFNEMGRPYKNPWTYRQGNPVKSLEVVESGKIRITFSDEIPLEMTRFLKKTANLHSLCVATIKIAFFQKQN